MKRSTCLASLVIILAWSMETRAGGPPPVYTVIDKVVLEPNEEAPTRIQIWGAFSLLREGEPYEPPVLGYLYYAAAAGVEEKCRKEWAVLKEMTGKKQLVSFGVCREPNVRDHLRKPREQVASPTLYPHGKGGFAPGKNAESNFPSLKKLLATSLVEKEPVYQSKSPKYCRLVFDADAKTHVWLVLDGDRLYVDRNANGNLTEENERIERNRTEFEADDFAGKAKYGYLRLSVQLVDPPQKDQAQSGGTCSS